MAMVPGIFNLKPRQLSYRMGNEINVRFSTRYYTDSSQFTPNTLTCPYRIRRVIMHSSHIYCSKGRVQGTTMATNNTSSAPTTEDCLAETKDALKYVTGEEGRSKKVVDDVR